MNILHFKYAVEIAKTKSISIVRSTPSGVGGNQRAWVDACAF